MTEAERIKMLQQRERSRASKAYPQSQGPKPGSVLQGRRGVAEDVPLEQLTAEQRKAVDYTPYNPGVPRLPRSGINAWDQTVNDGAGGYVPRAPDRFLVEPHDFYGDDAAAEAKAFGIDASAYEPDSPQLAADVAAVRQRHDRLTKGDKYTVEEIPGGGYRYKPGAPMIEQEAARKKKSALRTLATRFQREMNADRDGDGRPDFTYGDLEAAYNDPSLKDMDHTARMRFVNDNVADQFRTDRSQNIQQVIEQRAKQDNMARRLNTNVANVMFHDDLMNARTPEDRIRVLLSYHAQNPNLGYGNMAAYMQRGQDESLAMDAMAKREDAKARAANPVLSGPQDQAYIESLPVGPGRIEARKNAARKGYPGGAAPPEVVHDSIINGEVDNVRKIVGQRGMTDDERSHLREWTLAFLGKTSKGVASKSAYEAWAKFLGITPWSPQANRLWREATGRNIEESNNSLVPDSIYYSPYSPWNWGSDNVDPRQIPDPGK